MSKKHWYMEFDCARWKADTSVRRCCAATRGIWFDWLCAMHDADRCGILTDTVSSLAALATCSPREAASALTELRRTNAADVQLTGETENANDAVAVGATVTLTNRRMRREFVTRKLAYARKLRSRGQSVPDWITQLSRESSSSNEVEDDLPERPPTDIATVPARTKKPDPIWDTIAELFYDGVVTDGQRTNVGKLVAELKERNATPEEIRAVARRHERAWPGLTVTANSIVRHWGELKPRRRDPAPSPHQNGHVPKPAEQPISEADAKALLRRKSTAAAVPAAEG